MNKKDVLRVYPDAHIIVDTHYYGEQSDATKIPYLLARDIPENLTKNKKTGYIFLDCMKTSDILSMKALSGWCSSERECWSVAWSRIKNMIADKLNET